MSKEFEIARLAVIQAAHAGQVDEARAFGWANRIFPLTTEPLETAFKDDFKVSEQQVDTVIHEIVEMQESGKPISFYQIEGSFGTNKSGLSRSSLIYVLRMIFLYDRFDEKTWTELTASGRGPVESQWLAKPFDAASDLLL